MNKSKILMVSCLTLICLYSSTSNAALLFEGGNPDGRTGLRIADISFFVSAADFTTTDVWRLTNVEFWSSEDAHFEWSGSIDYYIFSDGSATPAGQPIVQGNGVSITKSPDSNAGVLDHSGFKYSFDLQTPAQLNANTTYWLGLTLGVDNPTIENTQAFWASTARPGFGSDAANTSDPAFSAWSQNTFDLAFRLNGAVVPIPATVWLFGSGLIGLIGVARRKA